MSRMQIDKNKRMFLRDGKPFFWLADTIWSAFTNITFEEWEFYLNRRKNQGFNTLQINILPQWDRCLSDVGLYPAETADGQKFQFGTWNDAYFDRAAQMCEMAVAEGFQLALILLWVNYVPGTWGSRMLDCNIMPEELLPEYAGKVTEVFEPYDPVYVISGDTDFETEESVRYYRTVMDKVCEQSPDSLKSCHIKRGYSYIPADLEEKMDFYMFQSGHNVAGQDQAWRLAEHFYAAEPAKPLINAEPCYEQMGYSRQMYGRFDRFDVRKAAWTSLLSGACAGITYGAHGVWNWQKLNKPKNMILGEGFDDPLPWEEALTLPGAWDYGYMKYLAEEYDLGEMKPCSELVENNTEDIRMAQTGDRYFIYTPANTNLLLRARFEEGTVRVIDLEQKNVAFPSVEEDGTITKIELHRFEKDVLVIGRKA